MNSTLTDLQRKTRRIFSRVGAGHVVTVTNHGEVVGKITPAAPRRVVSIAEFREADISDAAIVEALQEANG